MIPSIAPSPYTRMIFGTRVGPRVMSPHVKVWFSENGPIQGEGAIWNRFEINLSIPSLRFCVVGKNRSMVFCNLKQCFLHSTKTLFNRTRLDRRGLKNNFSIIPNRWSESSKFEIKHGLPYMALTWGHPLPLNEYLLNMACRTWPLHGVTPLTWHGPFFLKSCSAGWANPCRSPYMGSVCERHTRVKPMTSKGAILIKQDRRKFQRNYMLILWLFKLQKKWSKTKEACRRSQEGRGFNLR